MISIRHLKEEAAAFKASGDTFGQMQAQHKLNSVKAEYNQFSKAMGLPVKDNRLAVAGFRGVRIINQLTNDANKSIIIPNRISGALNPYSEQADIHAKKYYETIRNITSDIKNIARNTGYKPQNIEKIKNYIFNEKHDLGNVDKEYFYPSYDMAQSWQRLIDGKNIHEKDYILLKHEYLERALMERNYSQDYAHTKASKKFNYAKYSDER